MFEPNCLFKVDEFGFFLTWKSEGKVWPGNTKLFFPAVWVKSFYFSVSTQVHLEGMDPCLFIHSGFLEFASNARRWEYSDDQAIILALIDSRLGANSGIKKRRYKSVSIVKGKVRLLQELTTGRSDLIVGIRKVSQKKLFKLKSQRCMKNTFSWSHRGLNSVHGTVGTFNEPLSCI